MEAIPWEDQIKREVEWWLNHGSVNMAVQSHTDFFEHIYTTYARSLHGKRFKQALEIGPGASGGYLAVMPDITKRVSLDPISGQLGAKGFLPFRSRIRYITGFAERMPFGDKSFDLIIISNALDHVRDMDKAMSEIKRVIRPGGYLFFFTFLNVQTPHPWTFNTVEEAMAMFKGFKIIEAHAITQTRKNNFMRARNPYYTGVYQYENM